MQAGDGPAVTHAQPLGVDQIAELHDAHGPGIGHAVIGGQHQDHPVAILQRVQAVEQSPQRLVDGGHRGRHVGSANRRPVRRRVDVAEVERDDVRPAVSREPEPAEDSLDP